MNRLLAAAMLLAILPTGGTADSKKNAVIVDTDIGSYIDDPFALGLLLARADVDIRAITTCGKQAEDRAWIVCRFLSHSGLVATPIPVAAGSEPQFGDPIGWQIQYRRHPAAVFDRTQRPSKLDVVDLIHLELKKSPGEISILCLGPLTNIGRLLTQHPDDAKFVKQLIVMGGSFKIGYDGKAKQEPEWNIKSDVAAARKVSQSGIPITLVPLDVTATLLFDAARRKAVFEAHTRLTFQIQCLYELWDKDNPILFDVPAAACLAPPDHFKFDPARVAIGDDGSTNIRDGKPNCRILTDLNKTKFLDDLAASLAYVGKPTLPKEPGNRSKLIDRGQFPTRVHVIEDYETDIEKRWWMCGKLETLDIPNSGGRRACRAVLTQDFDDLMGDVKTMYRAVIFNPVPGPPMGPNTQLSFRYKLNGTDKLRVQLYSLTNGYHRYLSVDGLKQGQWREATVDMTQMRRPNGAGGALDDNERIDDIQFYIDPRAELLIDDIVLYEAAKPGETRPFPKRIVFAAWFDTGKQGHEWPGDFAIIAHQKPRTWKYAESVHSKELDSEWIRLSMRGSRRLAEKVGLNFKYRLVGASEIEVEIRDSRTQKRHSTVVKNLKSNEWSEATAAIAPGSGEADEIRFIVPKTAKLMLDDVILFEQ